MRTTAQLDWSSISDWFLMFPLKAMSIFSRYFLRSHVALLSLSASLRACVCMKSSSWHALQSVPGHILLYGLRSSIVWHWKSSLLTFWELHMVTSRCKDDSLVAWRMYWQRWGCWICRNWLVALQSRFYFQVHTGQLCFPSSHSQFRHSVLPSPVFPFVYLGSFLNLVIQLFNFFCVRIVLGHHPIPTFILSTCPPKRTVDKHISSIPPGHKSQTTPFDCLFPEQ